MHTTVTRGHTIARPTLPVTLLSYLTPQMAFKRFFLRYDESIGRHSGPPTAAIRSESEPIKNKTKKTRKKKPLGIHRNGKKRVKRKQTKKDNRITSAWSSVPAVFFSPHSSRLRDKANSVIFKHSAAKRYERDTLLSGGDDGSGTTLVDDHGTEKRKKRNETKAKKGGNVTWFPAKVPSSSHVWLRDGNNCGAGHLLRRPPRLSGPSADSQALLIGQDSSSSGAVRAVAQGESLFRLINTTVASGSPVDLRRLR